MEHISTTDNTRISWPQRSINAKLYISVGYVNIRLWNLDWYWSGPVQILIGLQHDTDIGSRLLPTLCSKQIWLPLWTGCQKVKESLCTELRRILLSTNIWIFLFLYQAVNKSSIELPHNVEDIMNPWILQMGFPLVTINSQTGQISQKHFLLDSKLAVDMHSEFK